MLRYLYTITGIVQGVGFRPFIYKLANQLHLTGFVFNDSSGVSIELQGNILNIEEFDKLLYEELPPLATIYNLTKKKIELLPCDEFIIIETKSNTFKTTLVSADVKVCDDCLADIKKEGKYYNYFATNCTNCGPRYSIIKTVPYDRINTSMDDFMLCDSCKEEYENPMKRRYHAQPISCNNCGPKLTLNNKEDLITDIPQEIYKQTAEYIKSGKILIIKGIGGFHIVCDATNNETIEKLRTHKHRPSKPFAIMCKDINQIKQIVQVNQKEEEVIESKEAPIVVCDKLDDTENIISDLIAPNINRIGCFLPYTPLHHLLFEHLDNPIVATSANLNGEPIITNKDEIIEKLPFIDYIVDFNREIINAVDDSVVQIIDEDIQLLRAGRGYTPKVIKLKNKISKKILAVGANAKNTISIAFDDTIIVSPYIGDLDSIVSFDYFLRTIETFKKFYDFEPDLIIHDKHPNYETTKWAKKQNIELVEVQHHLAHIYATKAEFFLENKEYVGFSFDGTGYGDDGSLWGGEVFVNDERKYHFKPIKLLGATKAIQEPRRIALSLLFDNYSLDEVLNLELDTVKAFTKQEINLLYLLFCKNLNTPLSSSVGRIFDAIASLANLVQIQSYEGEAGLVCEKHYNPLICESFEYEIIDGIIDIKYDFFHQELVSLFINTLVQIIFDISKKEGKEVLLVGGVFQNKTLLELIKKKFEKEKIHYFYQIETPTNDSGISLGQIYYYLQSIL
jgi:hydrogenase maturation protein HypF